MLRPEYPIKTERLLLRPVTLADTDAMLAYKSREDVCQYLPYDELSRDEVIERIGTRYANTTLDDEGQALTLAVEERGSGTLVGDVVLFWRSRRHRGGEIGYVLHPDHVGRGYATEAAAELLRLGFDELGLHRIVGLLDARNTASVRVLERLGMRREAHLVQNEFLKGDWRDELIFAQLADEWQRLR